MADVATEKGYMYDLSEVNSLGMIVAEEKTKYN